jgi:hypothetical protein
MEFAMTWIQVGTIVGANLGMFLWTVRQSRADYLHCQRSIDSFKDAMQKESKDFHTKLALQDQDFKNKMAMQDKEFKNHIKYFHHQKVK